MSKRLQVMIDEQDLRTMRRIARRQRVTLSEWVRRALRAAAQPGPVGDTKQKLEVVRAAARHSFPVAEVGQMLAEIERGYGVDR